MSQALRKLSGAIKSSNTAMVFTNQLRHKIGIMFGSPETTSGGMALKFYASVRLDIRRIQAIKSGGEILGNRTRVRVKKNKVAPPFRECEFDIMYDEGVSKEGDVLDLGVELDIIEKRGSFYNYKDERLAQGRENAKQALRENPALCFEIENAIRRETGLPELKASPLLGEEKEAVGEDEAGPAKVQAARIKAATTGRRTGPVEDDELDEYAQDEDEASPEADDD
jgi:recombination protein RecA